MFYYIIPVKENYYTNPETQEQIFIGIQPEIIPTGKWVGDCQDGQNYLIKTEIEIPGYNQATSEEIITLGFDLTQVNNWNGGW